MKLTDIYSRKKQDIDFIEKRLEHAIHTDQAILREASLHLLRAGGKRIRPVFVLLAGEFGTYDIKRIHHVAVSLELLHMASLVHDDVIDDSPTRRGQQTVRSKWDNRIAMFTGDYIIGKALHELTHFSSPVMHQVMSNAIIEMCIGEMEQIRFFFEPNQRVRDYLLRIKRKTALLIAVACQLGALAAGASEQVARKLYDFGYYVGMAFQIRDDILDLCGTEKQIGKAPGSDIKQGNVTIPVLYAMMESPVLNRAIRSELERIQAADGQTDVSYILEMIRTSDAVKRTDKLAQFYIEKAIRVLQDLPDIKARKEFEQIAHFIGNRSY
ncbi:polyprenyl synthetase family protein [Paenibacillus sp. N1-5-1-14]|uniref:polyprenyl synthetase family protein n=1 Tax=Paenibacillus radicibacter TaxID=2972488 RepID=UPI0021595D7F|nr:polyprenyl synthetase family protein [Paenibacillus radicibacter]MCR8642291.1 polyprenyl synthetase family protein [Paenibacillus radicibacter]